MTESTCRIVGAHRALMLLSTGATDMFISKASYELVKGICSPLEKRKETQLLQVGLTSNGTYACLSETAQQIHYALDCVLSLASVTDMVGPPPLDIIWVTEHTPDQPSDLNDIVPTSTSVSTHNDMDDFLSFYGALKRAVVVFHSSFTIALTGHDTRNSQDVCWQRLLTATLIESIRMTENSTLCNAVRGSGCHILWRGSFTSGSDDVDRALEGQASLLTINNKNDGDHGDYFNIDWLMKWGPRGGGSRLAILQVIQHNEQTIPKELYRTGPGGTLEFRCSGDLVMSNLARNGLAIVARLEWNSVTTSPLDYRYSGASSEVTWAQNVTGLGGGPGPSVTSSTDVTMAGPCFFIYCCLDGVWHARELVSAAAAASVWAVAWHIGTWDRLAKSRTATEILNAELNDFEYVATTPRRTTFASATSPAWRESMEVDRWNYIIGLLKRSVRRDTERLRATKANGIFLVPRNPADIHPFVLATRSLRHKQHLKKKKRQQQLHESAKDVTTSFPPKSPQSPAGWLNYSQVCAPSPHVRTSPSTAFARSWHAERRRRRVLSFSDAVLRRVHGIDYNYDDDNTTFEKSNAVNNISNIISSLLPSSRSVVHDDHNTAPELDRLQRVQGVSIAHEMASVFALTPPPVPPLTASQSGGIVASSNRRKIQSTTVTNISNINHQKRDDVPKSSVRVAKSESHSETHLLKLAIQSEMLQFIGRKHGGFDSAFTEIYKKAYIHLVKKHGQSNEVSLKNICVPKKTRESVVRIITGRVLKSKGLTG